MTYSIELKTDTYLGGVTLVVTHTCGHEGRYYFGGAEYAEREAAEYEDKECFSCRNEKWLEEYRKNPPKPVVFDEGPDDPHPTDDLADPIEWDWDWDGGWGDKTIRRFIP